MRVNTLMTDTGNTYVPSLSYQLTVNNSSYGDSLYMDEKAVEDVIEIINELSRKFYEVFSDLLLVYDIFLIWNFGSLQPKLPSFPVTAISQDIF